MQKAQHDGRGSGTGTNERATTSEAGARLQRVRLQRCNGERGVRDAEGEGGGCECGGESEEQRRVCRGRGRDERVPGGDVERGRVCVLLELAWQAPPIGSRSSLSRQSISTAAGCEPANAGGGRRLASGVFAAPLLLLRAASYGFEALYTATACAPKEAGLVTVACSLSLPCHVRCSISSSVRGHPGLSPRYSSATGRRMISMAQ